MQNRADRSLPARTRPVRGLASGRAAATTPRMDRHEKTFVLRFTLEAEIPGALVEQDEFEEDAWLDEWEVALKPGIIRAVFTQLRATPGWSARVRNRGISPLDEIEIVVSRRFGEDPEDDDATE